MPPRKNRIDLTCEQCGAPFQLLESQAKNGRGRFCSRRCLALSKVEHLNATRKPATSNPGWFKSENVRGDKNSKWKLGVKLTCINCHQEFERKQWRLNQGGHTGDFCSKKCRDEYRRLYVRGENSPLWKGGYDGYRGRGWAKIRLLVVKAQDGKCAHCGKYVGSSLPVHHVTPFREFQTPVEANRLENLIGLCQSCHMKLEMPEQWRQRRKTSGG